MAKVKIKLEALTDKNGKHLTFEAEERDLVYIEQMRKEGFESGQRFKKALEATRKAENEQQT